MRTMSRSVMFLLKSRLHRTIGKKEVRQYLGQRLKAHNSQQRCLIRSALRSSIKLNIRAGGYICRMGVRLTEIQQLEIDKMDLDRS